MSHRIVWSFDDGRVTARGVCDDTSCLSRYVCADEPCEVYFDVRREPDGTVTHKPWEDDHPAINRHRMELTNDCAVADFLNADPWEIPEMYHGRAQFDIGSVTIEPVWQGDDSMAWRLTPPARSTGEGRDG